MSLISLLELTARLELKIEYFRCQLARVTNFEPYGVFKYIASNGGLYKRENYSYMNAQHIALFLKENSIIISEEHIDKYFIFSRDSDQKGAINYSQFLKFILPQHNKLLRENLSLRETDKVLSQIPVILEKKLATLFKEEIYGMMALDEEKKSIDNISQKWDLIQNQGAINHNDLYDWLVQNDYFAFDQEIICMFSRIDSNQDGKISRNEFFNSLQPVSNLTLQTNQTATNQQEPPLRSTQLSQSNCSLDKKNRLQVQSLAKADNLECQKNELYLSYIQRSKSRDKNKKKDENNEQNTQRSSFKQVSNIKSVKKVEFDNEEYDQYLKTDLKSSYLERNQPSSSFQTPSKPNDYSYNNSQIQRSSVRDQDSVFDITVSKSDIQTQSSLLKLKPAFQSSNQNSPVVTHNDKLSPLSSPNLRIRNALVKSHDTSDAELMNILKQVVNMEKELEKFKQELSLRSDFNLMDFYNYLDSSKQGQVKIDQIEKLLNDLNVDKQQDEFYLFLIKLDQNMVGRIPQVLIIINQFMIISKYY